MLWINYSGDFLCHAGRGCNSIWTQWNWCYSSCHQCGTAWDEAEGEIIPSDAWLELLLVIPVDTMSTFPITPIYLQINTIHSSIQKVAKYFSLSLQNVLVQVPKLKHIIYVDKKRVNKDGYPAGLSIHSMQAVQELGMLPVNSAYSSNSSCLCNLVKFRDEWWCRYSIIYIIL